MSRLNKQSLHLLKFAATGLAIWQGVHLPQPGPYCAYRDAKRLERSGHLKHGKVGYTITAKGRRALARALANPKRCEIAFHRTCAGAGKTCKVCGDPPRKCRCAPHLETSAPCIDCKGTGQWCSEHYAHVPIGAPACVEFKPMLTTLAPSKERR